MPWYVIIRNPSNNRVMGFLTDGDMNEPQCRDTEEDAREMMEGHICESSCEYIELA